MTNARFDDKNLSVRFTKIKLDIYKPTINLVQSSADQGGSKITIPIPQKYIYYTYNVMLPLIDLEPISSPLIIILLFWLTLFAFHKYINYSSPPKAFLDYIFNCAYLLSIYQHEWLIGFVFLGGFAAIYFFYFMGHRERTVPHPFMTYMSKTLLFFYQVIRPIAEIANLNVDVSEEGTCLFKFVTSRGKLWLNLVVPGIIIFDMILFYIYVRIHVKRKKFEGAKDKKEEEEMRKNWLEIEWIAIKSSMWAMFLIVYVQITTSFIKLSLCFRFGGVWHMWYAGEVECFDAGHGISMFISFFLVFCVPYLMLRSMKFIRNRNINHDKILASLTLSYRENCWYYSAFNIFRRAILIVLPLIPTNDLSIRASFITFTVGLLLAVHCYLMPFKWSANNHLETFILIISFFISTLNIVDEPPQWFPILTAILALCPFLPCIILFHDFAQGKAKRLSQKIPELSFVWAQTDSQLPLKNNNNNRTNTIITAPPDDGEPGIQMSQIPKNTEQFLGENINNEIGRTATSLVPVKMDIDDDDEQKDEEKEINECGIIQHENTMICEDNLWKEISFGEKRRLQIYKRKKTIDNNNNNKEEEEEEQYNENEAGGGALTSSKTTRRKRRMSMFEKETVRNTKFGAERAWYHGSAPDWLTRWLFKQKYIEPIENDILITDSNISEIQRLKDNNNNIYDTLKNVMEIQKVANENENENDIDYILDDITIRTDESWIDETDDVLLPPTYEEHINKNSAPLTLFEIQTSVNNESSGDDTTEPELNRSRTIKKEKRKINKFIDTTYNIIQIKQKPWKKPQFKEEEEEEEENKQNDNGSDDDDGLDVATPLIEDDIASSLVGHGIGIDEYVIPNEYLYVNGIFSPKIFDEKFKSMVYVSNKNENLEMRVLEYDKSDIDAISIICTWIIVDIDEKIVLYQSDQGNNLYIPPINGWKRLIDENEYHSPQETGGNDLNVRVVEKEIKYGSIPSPEIIELSHSASNAIEIEYDYKKLEIKHVPYLKQWIEIIGHNITSPNNDEILKVIYIENNEEKTDSKQAYNIFTQNAEMLETQKGKKLKKLGWIRTTFEFDELLLENEYKFSIKLSNCITYTESVLSSKIMPMTLPSKGIINSVSCNSYLNELYINYSYLKINYENKSMNPLSFNILIQPWPTNIQSTNSYSIDKENKKIQISHEPILSNNNYKFEELIISNIIFGTEYNIIFECENEIGINQSEIYKYCPVCVPPKPIIESIETDDKNWTMTINVKCDGYNNNNCRAWFEIELIDPKNEKNEKNELMSDVDQDGFFIENKQQEEEKEEKEEEEEYASKLDDGVIKILKQKHYTSPIILQPIFAGQTYIIGIKCRNICAFTQSDIYSPIFVNKKPPIPIFTNKQAFDSSVVISYKCLNYQYSHGYEPIFELKATPHHKQQVATKLLKQRIEGLRNGWDYNFKVKAKNKLGESEWSQIIKLKPLKKPQIPENIFTIAGPKCITIVWYSNDNMEEPNINGKFIIISQPQTIEKQVRDKNKIEFQALDNDKYYKFKVIAINDNFKIESKWTKQIKPNPKKIKKFISKRNC